MKDSKNSPENDFLGTPQLVEAACMSFGHFENMTDSLNLRRVTNSPNYPVVSTVTAL